MLLSILLQTGIAVDSANAALTAATNAHIPDNLQAEEVPVILLKIPFFGKRPALAVN